MNVRRSRLAAGVFVSLGACALLSGCVGNPFADAKVDPRSPIAAEVASSVRPDAPYPTFRGIPPLPKDVRPHRQYGVQAAAIEKQAADLAAETSDSTWTLRHTDAFAAQARSDAGPELSSDQLSDTEAFAKGAKARATPPPPRPK
ncbi:MAG: hypothetical protein ACHP9T_10810 [Caulobacterales bacterium]